MPAIVSFETMLHDQRIWEKTMAEEDDFDVDALKAAASTQRSEAIQRAHAEYALNIDAIERVARMWAMRLSNWSEHKAELIREVRESEALTGEDLATRITGGPSAPEGDARKEGEP